jgi:hypothetical protein
MASMSSYCFDDNSVQWSEQVKGMSRETSQHNRGRESIPWNAYTQRARQCCRRILRSSRTYQTVIPNLGQDTTVVACMAVKKDMLNIERFSALQETGRPGSSDFRI